MKKKAFTLIELLLALGIVGAIAALTAPSIMGNINRRVLASQLKNITHDITFLIDEQLLNNNSKVIGNTDFKTPDGFFSHFEITKSCEVAEGETSDCWGESYKRLSNMSEVDITLPAEGKSVKLKNGAVLSYSYGTTEFDIKANPEWQLKFDPSDIKYRPITSFKLLPTYAAVLKQPTYTPVTSLTPELTAQPWQKFDPTLVTPELKYQLAWTGATVIVDINGAEAPNIVGRDLFEFTISNTGKLPTTTSSLASLKTNCQNGNASSCFTYVMANGWKMDY